MSATASTSAAPSFGIRIGPIGLLLPAGLPVAYLTDVATHPLPGAGPRVLGLMQVQGHPVVVLDPNDPPLSAVPSIRRMSVLVLGTAPEAGALRVLQPPEPIAIGASVPMPDRPACAFADALIDAHADAGRPDGWWWRFAPALLFARLSATAEPAPSAVSP